MMVGVLLVLLLADPSMAEKAPDPKLPPCEEWTAVISVSAIEQPLRDALLARSGAMADPGQPFSVGCMPGDGEAFARLLFAGRSGPSWVVAYERGGRAYRQEFSLWSAPDEGEPQLLGQAALPRRADDLCLLISELRHDRVRLETGS